jgi:hypothetical protein
MQGEGVHHPLVLGDEIRARCFVARGAPLD